MNNNTKKLEKKNKTSNIGRKFIVKWIKNARNVIKFLE